MPGEPRRILLIGRHELAHGLATRLHARGNPLAVLPARREDARRPSLGTLDLANVRRFEAGDALPACAEAFGAELVISAGYDRIVTAADLQRLPPAVNLHFGALPRYRGNLSIPWALMNGEREIGVTLHLIEPGIDDGAILDQRLLPVAEGDAAFEVYGAAVACGIGMALDHVAALEAGAAPAPRPQDERQATYYPPEFPGGFTITWRQTVHHVLNYIRACHFPPYPGAGSEIAGKRLEFAWPVEVRLGRPEAAPGRILDDPEKGPGIAVLNGAIFPGAVACGEERWPDFAAAVEALGLQGARFAPAPGADGKG
jgi:methionyl-tRNA formyltransferase